MKSKKLRMILSALSLCSLWMMTISANAAPIRFSQVIQVVSVKPGKANIGSFAQLRMVNDGLVNVGDDDDTKKTPAQQDGRVIVETRSEIMEDDACDCVPLPPPGGGFPKFALLGLAAIPLFFLIRHHDDTPTPTPTTTPTDTPTATPTTTPTVTPTPPDTPTPTPTPTVTPTPTPTPPDTPTPTPTPMTPTPTPPVTPTPTPTPPDTPTPTPTPMTPTPTPTPTPPPMTPTPTPTPEPVTMLLFGTGLAGIGFAARKRLRRKEDSTEGK